LHTGHFGDKRTCIQAALIQAAYRSQTTYVYRFQDSRKWHGELIVVLLRGQKGKSKQGSMAMNRKIFVTALAASAVALTPAAASAGSLLSGYGGPGQGSQEILGSAVVGGAGGGGGATGGGAGSAGGEAGSGTFRYGEPAGGQGSVQPGAHSATGAGGAGGGASSSHTAKPGSTGAGTGASGNAGARASIAGSSAYPTAAAERAYLASAASQAAGLPGSVWLYVALAVVVVALMGVITRRLADNDGPERHRSLKGRVEGPE
jgi:hypothetical protein